MTVLAAALLLTGCGSDVEQTAALDADAKTPWAVLAAEVIAEHYRRDPERAVDAGLHEHDGQMSDLSMEALEDKVARKRGARITINS